MQLEIRVLRMIISILLPLIIILLGIFAFLYLSSLRKPPTQAEEKERPVPVEIIEARKQDIPVTLSGFGTVRSITSTPISAEISGKVIRINPKLEVGEVIPVGEILFEIEPKDYEIRLQSAKSTLEQAKASLQRLKDQYQLDKERLKVLERSRDLALSEFQRVKELFENEKVGTLSNVELAERNYNQALDAYNQLSQAIQLYPLRIKETEESLRNAESQVDQAEVNLSRTVVKAPFNARVKMVNIEVGQFVSPGVVVMTIADDSILEISVPLDAREAMQYLPFQESGEMTQDSAWFSPLEPRECVVQWSEDKEKHQWKGTLHRIEKYDEKSRTVYVVIRLQGNQIYSVDADRMLLVEGMFCQVHIPGKVLKDVYKLPETAVTYDDKVYLSIDNRLKYWAIERLLIQGSEVIVRGLNEGDKVIVTRLINPIENTLLEIRNASNMGQGL